MDLDMVNDQVFSVFTTPVYPDSIIWSMENEIAIVSSLSIQIIVPNQLKDGSRLDNSAKSSIYHGNLDTVDSEQRDTYKPNHGFRKASWSPSLYPLCRGCALLTLTVDGSVCIYLPTRNSLFCTWTPFLDLSKFLNDRRIESLITSVDWSNNVFCSTSIMVLGANEIVHLFLFSHLSLSIKAHFEIQVVANVSNTRMSAMICSGDAVKTVLAISDSHGNLELVCIALRGDNLRTSRLLVDENMYLQPTILKWHPDNLELAVARFNKVYLYRVLIDETLSIANTNRLDLEFSLIVGLEWKMDCVVVQNDNFNVWIVHCGSDSPQLVESLSDVTKNPDLAWFGVANSPQGIFKAMLKGSRSKSSALFTKFCHVHVVCWANPSASELVSRLHGFLHCESDSTIPFGILWELNALLSRSPEKYNSIVQFIMAELEHSLAEDLFKSQAGHPLFLQLKSFFDQSWNSLILRQRLNRLCQGLNSSILSSKLELLETSQHNTLLEIYRLHLSSPALDCIDVYNHVRGQVTEFCGLCLAPIHFENAKIGTCENDHLWKRSPITFNIVDCRHSKNCSWCLRMYNNFPPQAILSPFQALENDQDTCYYCGGPLEPAFD